MPNVAVGIFGRVTVIKQEWLNLGFGTKSGTAGTNAHVSLQEEAWAFLLAV